MALREVIVNNSITVYPAGQIVVDKTISVYRDGVEISKENESPTYNPGEDISGEDQRTRDIAALVWTESLITKFSNDLATTTKDFVE